MIWCVYQIDLNKSGIKVVIQILESFLDLILGIIKDFRLMGLFEYEHLFLFNVHSFDLGPMFHPKRYSIV